MLQARLIIKQNILAVGGTVLLVAVLDRDWICTDFSAGTWPKLGQRSLIPAVMMMWAIPQGKACCQPWQLRQSRDEHIQAGQTAVQVLAAGRELHFTCSSEECLVAA